MFKLIIKRFLLIFIGIILSLVLLEFGLRLAGWTISYYQQYKNNKSLKNKSQYTIMCLGESTTIGQYPVQLTNILNKKYPNKFSIIDCGIHATNLEIILELLDNNINKYEPNIAICMMGVNNNKNFTNIEQNDDDYVNIIKSKKINLKIIKLFVLIKKHLNGKKDLLFAQEQKNTQELLDSAYKLHKQHKIKEANLLYEKVLQSSEKDSSDYQTAYSFLISHYLAYLKDYRGLEMAINAIKRNYYDKESYYFYSSEYLINTKDFQKLKMVISFLLEEKIFIPSMNIYNKIKPYLTESESSILLKKILSSYENNVENYHCLAMYYLKKQDYQNAQEYFDKAEQIRLKFPDLELYNVYKLILKKLIDNNIKVICMQYPVRSILPLQEQLKDEPYYDKLTFISNEKLFKNALTKKNYDDLFNDQFAGDFGHCTDLGNTLIAENVIHTLEKILDLKEK